MNHYRNPADILWPYDEGSGPANPSLRLSLSEAQAVYDQTVTFLQKPTAWIQGVLPATAWSNRRFEYLSTDAVPWLTVIVFIAPTVSTQRIQYKVQVRTQRCECR